MPTAYGLNFAAKTEYSDASEHLYEDIPENSIVNDAEPPEISNAEGENSVSEKNTELTADTESIADSNSRQSSFRRMSVPETIK